MFGRSLEQLFERYRKRGDAAALSEVFDRTAAELLRLAMHLVRDGHEAEDVLQATYVAAIDGAASWDRSRRLVPWLAGILARQAALARRRGRRAIDPALVRERESEDPTARAEAAEVSAELARALESLPEPYREVLRLHLVEGMKSVDVARALGRAPGTVRMQVHRGLELLRRALPAGVAAAGFAAFAPRGLAALRSSVLEHAARGAAAPLAGSAPAAALPTAAQLAAALSALLVASAAWAALRLFQPPQGGEAELGGGSGAARERGADLPASAVGRALVAGPAGSIDASPVAAEGPRTLLVGRVLGAPGPEHASVAVRGLARFAWPRDLVVRGAADLDGRFELDVAPLFVAAEGSALEELVVRADHPACLPAEARVRAGEGEVELALSPACALEGRVELPSGRPMRIDVSAVPLEGGRPDASAAAAATTCDRSGRYRLRLPEGAEHAIVALADGFRPWTTSVFTRAGGCLELPLARLSRGEEIGGRVDFGGLDPAGTIVRAVPEEARGGGEGMGAMEVGGEALVWRGGAFERHGSRAVVDERGTFRCGGLERGEHVLGIHAGPGGAALLAVARGETGASAPAEDVEIRMPLGLLEVSLVDEEGVPAGGLVRVEEGELPLAAGEQIALAVEPRAQVRIAVRAEGRAEQTFDLPGPAAGTVEHAVLALDGRGERPGAAALAVQCVLPAGHEASEVTLELVDPAARERGPVLARNVPLEGRLARTGDLPSGEWLLAVRVGGGYRHYVDYLLPCERAVRLAAGVERAERFEVAYGGRLRLDVRDAAGRHVAARCRVRDGGGAELDVRFLARQPSRVSYGGAALSDVGVNDVVPNLPEGEYEVELALDGGEAVVRRVRVSARETTALAVTLD